MPDMSIKDCCFLEGITVLLMVQLFLLSFFILPYWRGKKSFPLPLFISFPAPSHNPSWWITKCAQTKSERLEFSRDEVVSSAGVVVQGEGSDVDFEDCSGRDLTSCFLMPFSTTTITSTIILPIANQKLWWCVTKGWDSRRDVAPLCNLGVTSNVYVCADSRGSVKMRICNTSSNQTAWREKRPAPIWDH